MSKIFEPGAPLSIRHASPKECRRAIRRAEFVAEWGDMKFYCSKRFRCIVRSGYGGIDGGWIYLDSKSIDHDWAEIAMVAIDLNNGKIWKRGENGRYREI